MTDHANDNWRDDPLYQEAMEPVRVPSARIRGALWYGTLAVLLTSALSGASSIVALVQGKGDGFTLAHGLAWAALVPAMGIFAAYVNLGEEIGSPALGKSAFCLFGISVLLELYELLTLGLFATWFEVVLWIAFAIGVIMLAVVPFTSDDKEEKPAAEPPPAEEPAAETPVPAGAGTNAAGILGALGLALVGCVKVFGKVLVKIPVFKGLAALFRVKWDWALIAGGVGYLFGGVVLIWFGIMKIRLRRHLGPAAGFVGWMEVLGFLVCAAVIVGMTVQAGAAAEQPGIGKDELAALQRQYLHDVTMLELGANVLWASLTVWLFASLRRRAAADAEIDPWGEAR